MYVLDSSVLIDFLRGSSAALRWMETLDELPLCSEVTRAEVLRGVRSAERSPTDRLLQTLRWAPVDEAVSRRAGELGRRHRRSHRGIGVADLLIAATALVHGAELATANVRHYPMFPGLAPPYAD
ncbi:MAG TPA: type II toxin-antitoxin system VapC family toxin [Conexibacter sp.]|nr:type II toxin-antitoxin system VapC family toxin [Conexibacter sp.]